MSISKSLLYIQGYTPLALLYSFSQAQHNPGATFFRSKGAGELAAGTVLLNLAVCSCPSRLGCVAENYPALPLLFPASMPSSVTISYKNNPERIYLIWNSHGCMKSVKSKSIFGRIQGWGGVTGTVSGPQTCSGGSEHHVLSWTIGYLWGVANYWSIQVLVTPDEHPCRKPAHDRHMWLDHKVRCSWNKKATEPRMVSSEVLPVIFEGLPLRGYEPQRARADKAVAGPQRQTFKMEESLLTSFCQLIKPWLFCFSS